MSPRKPDALPPEVVTMLTKHRDRAAVAQDELKAVVREALTYGSVRQVAKALGISPTTVQAWKAEADQ